MINKKTRLWLCLIAAIAILLYCLVGYLQAIWLSATPRYPQDVATRNSILWGVGTVVFFVLTVVLGIRLFLSYRRKP